MKTSLVIATLGLCLATSLTTAHAKPKAIPHAVLMQQLTTEERACRAGGVLVQLIAVDRDAMVPLTTTRARLRIILATSSAEYEHNMVEIAQLLYQTPKVSGARARQLFETGCLNTTTSVARRKEP